MQQVPYLTKKDSVAELLRNEILSGAIPPGTQLRQLEVAGRLGVSQTPVREAFGILEAEGVLERRPYHGVMVARNIYEDLEDVYEIRTALEVIAIRRAATMSDKDHLVELEDAMQLASVALKKRDVHGFRTANAQFHQILCKASGSELLVEIMNKLLSRSLFSLPLNRQRMLAAHREHVEILAAVKCRRPNRAAEILARHLANIVSVVQPAADARRIRSSY